MGYHFVALHLVLIFFTLVVYGQSHYFIKPLQEDTCLYHPCLTLSQLASNYNSSYHGNQLNSALSLFFMPGNHTLDKELSLVNEYNLSMTKYAEDEDNVTIQCLLPNGRLIVSKTKTVSIRSLQFVGCGGSLKFSHLKEFVLEDATFQDSEAVDTTLVLNNIGDAFIVRSSFIDCGNIRQNRSRRFWNDRVVLYYVYLERSTTLLTGGAVYISFSNVSILSSNFIYNRADIGGALFAHKSNVSIAGNTFTHNRARLGGVIVTSESTVIVDNSTFSENTGEIFGGVLLSYQDSFRINSTYFVNNIAGVDGGVMNTFKTVVSITDSSFKRNTANQSCGVICAVDSFFHSTNTDFMNNTATFQGGVIITKRKSLFNIANNIFYDNRANDDGGVLVSSDKTIFNIVNCAFIGNSAAKDCGVIITVDTSSFIVTNSTFTNNSATYGGVMCTYHASSFNITGSLFSSNSATHGSIMYTYDDSKINISYGNAFIKNRAHNCGVMCIDERSLISISQSTFSENSANEYGGVIMSYSVHLLFITSCSFTYNNAEDGGGVIFALDNSSFKIDNSNFANNNATDFGGVIYATGESSFNITNSSFLNNLAVNDGGVFYTIRQPSITIISSIFTNNNATNGGVFDTTKQSSFTVINSTFCYNYASYAGGVMYTFKNSLFKIINCTFSRNIATDAGGVIYALRDSYFTITESTFINNFANNDGGVVNAGGNTFLNITNSVFANNAAADNGGVLYMTQNSSFIIVKSTFTNNSASRYGGVIIMYADSPLNISSSTFTSNTALDIGGVIYCFGSIYKIVIHKCNFHSNVANNFGATLYSLRCSALITNSTFVKNSGSLYIFSSNVTFTGYTNFISNVEPLDHTLKENAILTITRQGGAITCFQSNVLFAGVSTFLNNHAQNGGAILAAESTILLLDNTTIAKNLAAYGNGGGISLQRSNLQIRGHCSISQNRGMRGGGIHATSSTITVDQPGTLQLINNRAKDGGGIYLEINGKLYIQKTSRGRIVETLLSFTGNYANYGGAVYVSDDTNSGACLPGVECFFQTLALHQSQITNYTTNMYFSKNTAAVEASNIFGGLLDRCVPSPFAELQLVKQMTLYNGISYLKYISNVSLDSVGSPAVRVCFCTIDNEPDCSYHLPTIRVKKGETFTVSLVAVDQIYNSVAANIISSPSSPEGGLGEGQQTQAVLRNCTNLTFNLFSPHDSEKISISADGPCGSASLSTSQVTIAFLDCTCPIGFVQLLISQPLTRCECICDPQLSLYISGCNSSTGFLYKSNTNSWITFINDSDSSGYVIHSNCPFNYCERPTKNISINLNHPNGEDGQCASNRRGLLCGACQLNYSLSLGSNYCLSCPGYWPATLATILIFSIIAGIMLVAVLLALNITVTVGLINSFIFYANIVSASSGVLFPSTKFYFPAIFVSWLNLEIGVDVCLYDGLDAYTKTWIQLAFPVYIISLVLLIIKISEHSPKFTRLIARRDPVATLATLILLSYAKLLSVTITALSSASLRYPNGTEEIVWLPDASVKYFQGKHIPLVLVALLIALLGLPYTILLFLWQWIVRAPKWKVFKWTRSTKFNSFISVHQVPFNPKYRFWTGLVLLVRVVLYITASLTLSSNPQTVLLTTIILVGSLILLKGIIGMRIHKKVLVDVVESLLYFNLLALTAFSLYDYKTDIKKQYAVAYTSIIVTFVLLVGVTFYHMYLLNTKLKCKLTTKAIQEYPLSQVKPNKAEITCSVIEPPEPEEEVSVQEINCNVQKPLEIVGTMTEEYH